MPSIRDFLDPGGRMLAHRLDRLCMTLEGFGTRLRGTIASAIGEMFGGIVRDVALRVLDEATRRLPGNAPGFPPRSKTAPGTLTRTNEALEERSHGTDDEDRHEPDVKNPPSWTPPERLPAALSAVLQAASWWLWCCSGQGQTLTTLAVGVFATALAFLCGPRVIAVLGLAESATRFPPRSDALGADLSGGREGDSI